MKLRTISTYIFLILVVPLLFFGAIELLARFFEALGLSSNKNSSDLTLDMPAWMVPGTSKPKKYSADDLKWMNLFESGDGFRVRMRPNVSARVKNTFSLVNRIKPVYFNLRSNSEGFRSSEFDYNKPKGSFRLLLFGDSSSFGWGVERNEIFFELLADKIKKSRPSFKVQNYNLSMPGDSSEFGRLIFDKYIDKLSPDLVIVSFGANDARRASIPHHKLVARYQSQKTLQKIRTLLLRHLATARYINGVVTSRRKAKKWHPVTNAVGIKRYKKNLGYFIKRSRGMGAKKVLLLSLCSPGNYAAAMKEVAQEKGALYLNGQKILRNAIRPLKAHKIYPEYVRRMEDAFGALLKTNSLLYVTTDGCHPNRVANRILAEELYRIISPDKQLSGRDTSDSLSVEKASFG
ncbi:MAG: hypothetical protein D6719_10490 [Candidatus Dadabacteria bacterium]|nr:MAG: hypothetical protein D6719_10490 [Candidatus Dadabacteria bacterium]